MSNNQYFTDDNQYREFLDKIEVLNHDEEFEKIIDIIIENDFKIEYMNTIRF